MSVRFAVLASGSAGNATFIEADGFGLLLDVGLGPRQLAARMKAVGASWDRVRAVLLTHTHGDHWHGRSFTQLCQRGIRLYCHAEHHAALASGAAPFTELKAAGLVRDYEVGQEFSLSSGLRCRALPLRHDSGATFGFRLETSVAALAYAADLGSWSAELVPFLTNVDVLALEFNHDVGLQHGSGRSFHLIRRVLGDWGHLSNTQAAQLVREILHHSSPGRLRHLVQLHLSRDCNRPALARQAAQVVLAGHEVEIHTACQDTPTPPIILGAPANRPRRSKRAVAAAQQPWLPGLEPN